MCSRAARTLQPGCTNAAAGLYKRCSRTIQMLLSPVQGEQNQDSNSRYQEVCIKKLKVDKKILFHESKSNIVNKKS